MIGPSETLSIARQCALLSISRSSWYYEGQGESPFNLLLMRLIDEQFLGDGPGTVPGRWRAGSGSKGTA